MLKHLNLPLHTSVTLWEVTAPVKLSFKNFLKQLVVLINANGISLMPCSSHLFYTTQIKQQLMIIVKVHGVFPSNYKKPASSRAFQFHQAYARDSGEVVTPFMQVGTRPTRTLATFGPSELQPSFTGL
jgi:hypothetical protein